MMRYSPADLMDFFRGEFRYYVYYYLNAKWLIRPHIREQFELRLKMMDTECYAAGSCKICGCTTTKLQFANKSCEKPCYPPFMNSRQWKAFKGMPVKQSQAKVNRIWQEVGVHLFFHYGAIGFYADMKNKRIWINCNDSECPLEVPSLIKMYKDGLPERD